MSLANNQLLGPTPHYPTLLDPCRDGKPSRDITRERGVIRREGLIDPPVARALVACAELIRRHAAASFPRARENCRRG